MKLVPQGRKTENCIQLLLQEGTLSASLLDFLSLVSLLAEFKMELAGKTKMWFTETQPQHHEAQYRRIGLKLRDNNQICGTVYPFGYSDIDLSTYI